MKRVYWVYGHLLPCTCDGKCIEKLINRNGWKRKLYTAEEATDELKSYEYYRQKDIWNKRKVHR